MSPRIPTQPASSRSSVAAFDLRTKASPTLALWWLAVHALAVAGVCASGLDVSLRAAGAALLLLHAALRRPSSAGAIERDSDGRWRLPASGAERLMLAVGTSVGPFWIRLRLRGVGRPIDVLILRDQVDRQTWRALQAELRRATVELPTTLPGDSS